jgi:hypothetical protein
MRHSTHLFIVLIFLAGLVAVGVRDYQQKRTEYHNRLWMRKRFQQAVGLTDLSITTAARYLRHYTISDLTTPFQDYPASLDHFPAGFVYAPPDYSGMPSSIRFGNYASVADKKRDSTPSR